MFPRCYSEAYRDIGLLGSGDDGVLVVKFETFDGILHDLADSKSFGRHGFLQNRAVVIGYGTRETNRFGYFLIFTFTYFLIGEVLVEIAADELDEMVIDEIVDTLVVQVIRAELRERSQIAVREWLAIDVLDDVRHGSVVLAEEKVFVIGDW